MTCCGRRSCLVLGLRPCQSSPVDPRTPTIQVAVGVVGTPVGASRQFINEIAERFGKGDAGGRHCRCLTLLRSKAFSNRSLPHQAPLLGNRGTHPTGTRSPKPSISLGKLHNGELCGTQHIANSILQNMLTESQATQASQVPRSATKTTLDGGLDLGQPDP